MLTFDAIHRDGVRDFWFYIVSQESLGWETIILTHWEECFTWFGKEPNERRKRAGVRA